MKIVVLDSGYKSYEYEKSLFNKHGYQLSIYPSYSGSKSEKTAFAKDANGILVRHTKIDADFLSVMNNLKAIVRYGVGYDNIDVGACSKFGVKVANVQGYANHSVSDHALALLLSCTRGMWNTQKQLLNQFAAPPSDDILELHDKTLGIIGLGRIGGELSRKAAALFGRIIATDPYKSQEYFQNLSVEKVDYHHLIKEADVISVHCNLTDETRHLLNNPAFSGMKKRPVIINTSRGETVDEKALLNALKQDKIHSAGIDVFENEPPTKAQLELIHHERTICTGHYAWYSENAAAELQKRAARNLLGLLQEKEIEDRLN